MIKKLSYLSFIIIFFSIAVFSKENSGQINGIESLKESLITIEQEVLEVKKYPEEIIKREKEIYDFKVRFSDLITNFITNEIYKVQFQENRRDLDKLHENVIEWGKEISLKKDKINDLTTVLKQIKKSFEEAKKNKILTKAENIKSLIRKSNKSLRELNKIMPKLNKHEKFLGLFLGDITKWKEFLVRRIKKGNLDNGLLKWELNPFYKGPITIGGNLLNLFKKAFITFYSFNYSTFFKNNLGVIVVRLLLSFVFCGIIYFGLKSFKKWFKRQEGPQLDSLLFKILELITTNHIVLTMLGMIVYLRLSVEGLDFNNPPVFLHFIFLTGLVYIFWFKIGSKVVDFFILELDESDRRKNYLFGNLPFLVFIFAKTFQIYFKIDNNLLYLINSLMIAWISYQVLYLLFSIRHEAESSVDSEIEVLVKSTRAFVTIFSSAILFSSALEFIGFLNLGRSIQLVVISNALLFLVGWTFYQAFILFLNNELKSTKKIKGYKQKIELLKFLKNSLNILFLLSFTLLVAESWFNTIFVFENFWDITIIKIGEYKLTLDRPVKLVVSYYSLKCFYLLLLYFLDIFILKRLNISRKYSANIISVMRYFFILIFISIIAGILGVTYKNLIIFASALGVGIGFGLQNIVNNFISGIILLFERPIRAGDIIEVDGVFSKVEHIGMRSTIVETLDNSSIVIPNSQIISNKLINWTLNNSLIAIHCEVGVAYGTDSELVSSILKEAALEEKYILNNPECQVWFEAFGDSALQFNLKVWINAPVDKFIIHSNLMHIINRKLKEQNIVIPFPQRDIHLYGNSSK